MADSYDYDSGSWTLHFQLFAGAAAGDHDADTVEKIISDETTPDPAFTDRYLQGSISYSPKLAVGQLYSVNQIFPVDLAFGAQIFGDERYFVELNIWISTQYVDVYRNGAKVTDDYAHVEMMFDSDSYYVVDQTRNSDSAIYDLDTPDEIKLAPKAAFFTESDQSKIFGPYVSGFQPILMESYEDFFFRDTDQHRTVVDLTYELARTTGLFTEEADTVNLNTLDDAQKELARNDPADLLLHALAGDDTVTLPEDDAAEEIGFDRGEIFDGGPGKDHITGSTSADQIDGGDDEDLLIASPGDDTLDGGNDGDVFTYVDGPYANFASFTSGTNQTLIGGPDATIDSEPDVIRLPGAADDYSFAVNFGSTWSDTKTVIATRSASGFPEVVLNSFDVEHAVFKNPIDNDVTLTSGSVTVEMALLAKEVYGLLPTLEHKKEELLSDRLGVQLTGDATTLAAVGDRHWHPVSALELGIMSGDFNKPGQDLNWSFVGGHYAACKPSFLGPVSILTGDLPEANALVLTGVVEGYGKSLAIVLRGTDQWADFDTFARFKSYYSLYKPLVDGLRTYIAENQIDSILVSGHSLGAGALQYLLNEDFLKTDTRVHAWSYGSPGSEVAGNANLYNFVHTDDLVTKVPDVTNAAQLIGLAGLLTLNPYAMAVGVIGALADKNRTGSDVRINSDVSDFVGIDEHAQTLYVQDLIKLKEFSNDIGSPFWNSYLGTAIREGTTYTRGDIQVGVGRPVNLTPTPVQGYAGAYLPTINASKGDNYVLANNKNIDDDIKVSIGNLVANTTRTFDGGTGTNDRLILPYGKSLFSKEQVGPAWNLTFTPVNGSPEAVGSLYRVEGIVYSNAVEFLDGRVATIQKPDVSASGLASLSSVAAPAVPVFQLAAGFDAADAGNGNLTVLGRAGNDTLFVGTGAKTISLGAGRDIVMARYAATVSALTIDVGDSDDLVYAASGADTINGGKGLDDLNGGGGNDRLNGGTGADTMAGNAGDDEYVVDDVADLVFEAVGEGKDTVTTGVSYALAPGQEVERLKASAGSASSNLDLAGNEFANTLIGNAGANVLAGGAGKDTLDGGLGVDTADYGDKTVIVSVKLADGAKSSVKVGGIVEDTILNIENLNGGSGDDTLIGDGLSNSLLGLAGDDLLRGGHGNDVLDGGLGSDLADYSDKTVAVKATLAGVADATVKVGGIVEDTIRNIESIRGGSGDDALVGDGLANELFGLAGDDLLRGGAGNDRLAGGDGTDTASYAGSKAGVTVSLLTSGFQDTIGAGTDRLAGIENLTGSRYNDSLTGDVGNNVLTGDTGDDVLNGRAGNDRLDGGDGSDTASFAGATAGVKVSLAIKGAQDTIGAGIDTLVDIENLKGTSQADVLTGNGADNVLAGREGNDTLTGGAGKDRFVLDAKPDATSNLARITDFSVADDSIVLENAVFTTFTATGMMAASDFSTGIIYDKNSGDLFYDKNGSTSGGWTKIAFLPSGLALTNTDFLIA